MSIGPPASAELQFALGSRAGRLCQHHMVGTAGCHCSKGHHGLQSFDFHLSELHVVVSGCPKYGLYSLKPIFFYSMAFFCQNSMFQTSSKLKLLAFFVSFFL